MSWGESLQQCPSLAPLSLALAYRATVYTAVISPRPDAAIDPWMGDLWEKVLELYPVPHDLAMIPPGVP